MKRLRVGLDVDGVLADFQHAACRSVLDISIRKVLPSTTNDAFLAVGGETEFWKLVDGYGDYWHMKYLKPIEQAGDMVRELRAQGHDVWAVTSPPTVVKTWDWQRKRWLAEHFQISSNRVCSTNDKSAWSGDVLVDDYARNLREWIKYKGMPAAPVLLSQPWNEVAQAEDKARNEGHGIVVAADHVQVARILEQWARRQ